jgi:hypothetical protein
MDEAALQLALYLAAIALPGTLIGWTAIVAATGYLEHAADQPAWVRFLAERFVLTEADGRRAISAMCGILIIAVVNACPVLLLAHNPYGQPSLLVDFGYFLINGLLALEIGCAIPRDRARHRAQ